MVYTLLYIDLIGIGIVWIGFSHQISYIWTLYNRCQCTPVTHFYGLVTSVVSNALEDSILFRSAPFCSDNLKSFRDNIQFGWLSCTVNFREWG